MTYLLKPRGLYSDVKGTVSVISSNSPCKDGNARFTTIPFYLFLFTFIWSILRNILSVSRGFKLFNFYNVFPTVKCASHFCIEKTIEVY